VNVFSRSPFFTNGVACADIAMFDFVQNNKIAIQVILGAVALTFVGFGVGSYLRRGRPYLVKVGSAKIYKRDLDRMLEGSLQMLPLASRHWMI
jgi:hypothetical protein